MNLPAELTPNLWRLGAFHLAGFLIRGSQHAALFEVGISATAPLVLAQIDALGIPRREIRWVITSHAHSDHATGAAGLMAGLPDATLCMTAASAKHLAKESTSREFVDEDVYTAKALAGLGVKGLGRSVPPLPMIIEPLKIIEPGDTLDLGGLTLEFMGADGHVPGGLTALIPQRAALLASDSAGYVMHRPPGFPMFFVNYRAYLEQVRGMLDMKLEILAPGHQDWFAGPAINQYLQACLDDMRRDHDAVRAGAVIGRTPEDMAQEIYNDYYRDELTIFPPQAMLDASLLLVKRCLEEG